MKKLINSPETVVSDALRGLAAAHPGLRIDHERRLVLRAEPKEFGTVAIVSGGGSGHEPLHSGYVGFGMLDAACPGEIFTSPTPQQWLDAAVAAERGAGVLLVVKNYSGDVMNAEIAAELAAESRLDLRTAVIADDVSLDAPVRRGTGTALLVHRLVGAAAELGHDLDEVHALAERLAATGRSIGLALRPATVPAAGTPTFELDEDEIEWGVGIHGEPGRERQLRAPARELAARLVDPILADGLPSGPAIVLMSGLGATPLIELYVMHAEVVDALEAAGVTVARALVGNHVTALDMAGCSLTVLPVDDELLSLWDSPVDTPALRWGR